MVLYTEVDSSGMAILKFRNLSTRKLFMFGQRFVTLSSIHFFSGRYLGRAVAQW